MNFLVNNCLLILVMFASHSIDAQINIQEFTFAKLAQEKAKEPSYASQETKSAKLIPHFYRQQEELPRKFSGYVIELTTSDLPLKRDYSLFKHFGNVYYHQLKEGGYSYCIIANFSSKKSVQQFLNTVIIHHAPEARLIKYKKGIRKN